MITFNDSHRVSESNPIPYDEAILAKNKGAYQKGFVLIVVRKNNNTGPYCDYLPHNTFATPVDIGNITHFQRIEE